MQAALERLAGALAIVGIAPDDARRGAEAILRREAGFALPSHRDVTAWSRWERFKRLQHLPDPTLARRLSVTVVRVRQFRDELKTGGP